MKNFYIQDTTLKKIVHFKNVPEVVNYLNSLVERMFSKTRKSYMQDLIDLGHGYDDAGGVTFTNAMAEHVNIGVVNKDGKLIRCNIHDVANFKNEEYGD